MKKMICLLLCPLLVVQAQRKELTLTDLIQYSGISYHQFSSYVGKRGFQQPKRNVSAEPAIYFQKSTKDKIIKSLSPFQNKDVSGILFQTNSEAEFNELKEELLANGFIHVILPNPSVNETEFQRGNITIKTSIEKNEESRFFRYHIERKALPPANELLYAEDLLQLTSHEYFAAVFGFQNIKKDTFYTSEDEHTPCSVLFPGTNAQAIIVWQDVINYKHASFIFIGGALKGEETQYKQTQQNKWMSRQGIHLGMSLSELINKNNNHFDFYGWQSEHAGYVVPKTNGNLALTKIGVQLKCLDCKEDIVNSGIINTRYVISKGSRVYVDKLVNLP